ncbi:DUF6383 domain-containing protein [Parabacteroides sp. AF17-28]|uniref:DUF6383 domain-containing protein n=1 Tax=Parabacteroides sp. AF17-28 TaxID=2292241 RepID=UPI000F00B83A|nr:DUF6383 domain-containing protein [Parabacteroides sp. AF17-28]RHR56992.1 hypothetical protein DWW90_11715 [Parabacteroides sp. AF17-28]
MNKRFSTLVAAFAAFASVASAQIGDKYVYLVSSDTLTWTKESAGGIDSLVFKKSTSGTVFDTKAKQDSALWLPKFVEKAGADSVFQFVNKATNKNLSFSTTVKDGAGKYTVAIREGVDKFVFKNGVSGGSLIYGVAADGKVVTFNSTAGELEIVAGNSESLQSNKKFTTGTAVSIDLKTAEDLTGKINTFKLEFKGRDGNIFTNTDLIPVPVDVNGVAKFRFQVVGDEKSDKGTKAPKYITVDTVMIGTATSVQVAAFQLDTTVATGKTGSAYKGSTNEGLQTFKLSMDLGNDSIVITTDSIVKFANGAYYVADHGSNADAADVPYTVGYKTFNGTPVLCIDSTAIEAPFIVISKGTPVKLAGGTGVYSLQLKSATGQYKDYNNKFLVGNATRSAATSYADAASAYVPATQFYVKENADGTYSIQARDGGTSAAITATNGETLYKTVAGAILTDQPLYAVDAAKGIYAIGRAEGDTLAFTKLDVDMADKYIGYKYYTKEEMGYGAVKFNLASKAADDIYLTLVQDSVIAGVKGADKALELRLIEGADLNTTGDTIYYGAQALGDTLMRVAYGMEKTYNAEGARFAYESAMVKLADKSNGGLAENQKRFFFVENPAGGSYKIVAAATTGKELVTMNISNLAVTYDEPTASVETYFNIEGAEAPTYAKVAPGHYNVVNGNEMLTASADAAKFMRVGDELKATAEDSDFSLYIDSAYVNRGDDNTNYGYYIYKGATVKIASTEAAADTIKGYVLSAPKADNFKSATATGDSVIFCDATVIADTLWYDGEVDKKGNPIKHEVTSNKSVVMFEVQPSGDYAAVLMNAPAKKLAVVNGTVIFTDDVAAQPLTLTASEAPTANETTPSVSEVTVIAANGAIQIVGAQGKKVVVSNILGQTIANTVISSDNATIAAPAGVVVVAVEGEEAVKAIVK